MSNKKRPYMFCKACGAPEGAPLPRSTKSSAGAFGARPERRTAGTLRVAVPASAGAPWGGSPPLRPRPLLRLPVSAAGGGRLCSFSSPFRHRFRAFRIFAIKKRFHVSVKPWCAGRGPSPPLYQKLRRSFWCPPDCTAGTSFSSPLRRNTPGVPDESNKKTALHVL